jgi:hypothetical protein
LFYLLSRDNCRYRNTVEISENSENHLKLVSAWQVAERGWGLDHCRNIVTKTAGRRESGEKGRMRRARVGGECRLQNLPGIRSYFLLRRREGLDHRLALSTTNANQIILNFLIP